MTLYMSPDDGLHILDEPPQAEARGRRTVRVAGANWGAGFFGWLVAVAVAVLLLAVLGAALAALGRVGVVTARHGGYVSVAAWALGLVLLLVAYYAGGYVAGRMSRFNGGLQGVAVWIVGLLPTSAGVGLGLELGPVHDLIARSGVPALLSGARGVLVADLVIAALVVVGPLLAAVLGGRVGCRYHLKFDRVIDLAARPE